MRLKLALLTTAVAFGLGSTMALAEEAPGAKSDITIVAESPSGTYVNGYRTCGRTTITPGDTITAGGVHMRLAP